MRIFQWKKELQAAILKRMKDYTKKWCNYTNVSKILKIDTMRPQWLGKKS